MPILREFAKYHAAGNDFLLFEDQKRDFPIEEVPRLCDRHTGVGGDGVILALGMLSQPPFEMSYYNGDGSSGMVCGNGLRCFGAFLQSRGLSLPIYPITIAGWQLFVQVDGEGFHALLPLPKEIDWGIRLGRRYAFVVDTGAPHLVIFGEQERKEEGRELSTHPRFSPNGINVTFVEVVSEGVMQVRTFERGVWRETLSCGTGAAAALYIAHSLGKIGTRGIAVFPSNQQLGVSLRADGVLLSGQVCKVFDGSLVV